MLEDLRVVVLGRGMLGAEAIREFGERGSRVRSFDLQDWDITHAEDRERAVDRADIVVNCAAYTDVDGAESDRESAFAVNAEAVGALGILCAALDIPMLHVSTDFVFDGEKDGAYTEDDPTSPLNVYGESKLAGERALAESGCSWTIVRIQWSYGPSGVNFVTKICDLARTRGSLKVVDDQTGAPTSTADTAKAIVALIEKRATGLYHYAAKGRATRFDVAELIVRKLGLGCELNRCSSSEFPSPARRPRSSLFDCGKFDREIGIARPDWRDTMKAFLESMG